MPRSTLNNHISGRSKSFKRGRPTAFSENEEKVLAEYLKGLSNIGFGLDKQSLAFVANNYAKELGKAHVFKPNGPGMDWMNG